MEPEYEKPLLVRIEQLLRGNTNNSVHGLLPGMAVQIPGFVLNESALDEYYSADDILAAYDLPSYVLPTYTGMPTFRTESRYISQLEVQCPSPPSPTLKGNVVIRLLDPNPVNARSEPLLQTDPIPTRPLPPIRFMPGCPPGSQLEGSIDVEREYVKIWQAIARSSQAGVFGTVLQARDEPYCRPCAAGTFSNSSGAQSCMPCPAGFVAPVDGATQC